HALIALQIFVRDRTLGSRGHRAGVFGQHALGVAWGRLLPLSQAGLDLAVTEMQLYFGFLRIDRDGVTILDNCYGATLDRFRSDVAHNETVAATREAPVGDQGHVLAEPLAHDGRGRAEHLAHTGRPLGTFVANDQYIARNNGAIQDAVQTLFLGVEGSCLA